MTKAELRKIYIGRRRAITPETRAELSELIVDRLFVTVDFASRHAVNCYLSIENTGEVETASIFRKLWESSSSIITTAPRIDPTVGEVEAVIYDRGTALVEGPWRIPEPQGPQIDPSEIDLVIVPLLCFDVRGHRVGYGKGFYDRFLSRCRPDCLKVGLSFFAPVEKIEDVNDGDVALDLCVSSEKVYDFQRTI